MSENVMELARKGVDKALQATEELKDLLIELNLYHYLRPQIEFLQAYLGGEQVDHARLHDIHVGRIAAHEFEDTHPQYYALLGLVQYVASQKGQGLKMNIEVVKELIKEAEATKKIT